MRFALPSLALLSGCRADVDYNVTRAACGLSPGEEDHFHIPYWEEGGDDPMSYFTFGEPISAACVAQLSEDFTFDASMNPVVGELTASDTVFSVIISGLYSLISLDFGTTADALDDWDGPEYLREAIEEIVRKDNLSREGPLGEVLFHMAANNIKAFVYVDDGEPLMTVFSYSYSEHIVKTDQASSIIPIEEAMSIVHESLHYYKRHNYDCRDIIGHGDPYPEDIQCDADEEGAYGGVAHLVKRFQTVNRDEYNALLPGFEREVPARYTVGYSGFLITKSCTWMADNWHLAACDSMAR